MFSIQHGRHPLSPAVFRAVAKASAGGPCPQTTAHLKYRRPSPPTGGLLLVPTERGHSRGDCLQDVAARAVCIDGRRLSAGLRLVFFNLTFCRAPRMNPEVFPRAAPRLLYPLLPPCKPLDVQHSHAHAGLKVPGGAGGQSGCPSRSLARQRSLGSSLPKSWFGPARHCAASQATRSDGATVAAMRRRLVLCSVAALAAAQRQCTDGDRCADAGAAAATQRFRIDINVDGESKPIGFLRGDDLHEVARRWVAANSIEGEDAVRILWGADAHNRGGGARTEWRGAGLPGARG